MSTMTAPEHDPFRAMLIWSGVLHVVLLATLALGARLTQTSSPPFPADVAWIVPGPPGPGSGFGGGSPAPAQKTEPKPPEPPPPEPEPKKEEPRVVRPTKEERDQLPMPDAPKAKSRKREDKKASSGLVGKDAASADSARLIAPGAPGLGLGGTGGGGSAFDQDFEYAYYVQQMLARISEHWQRVPVRGEAVVVIRFTIFKDGRIEDVSVEQSSGLAMLDRAAQRAVMLADPLPMLPSSYPRDRVGVHLQFTYSEQY